MKASATSVVGSIVTACGVIQAAGWLVATRPVIAMPESVTMKLSTAVMFSLLGLSMVYDNSPKVRRCVLDVMMFLMLLSVMGPLAIDEDMPKHTVSPGIPSIATLVLFTLQAGPRLLDTACVTLAAGMCAVVGHLADVPAMFFYAPWSTGMAMSTAILFCLVGANSIHQFRITEEGSRKPCQP